MYIAKSNEHKRHEIKTVCLQFYYKSVPLISIQYQYLTYIVYALTISDNFNTQDQRDGNTL